MCVFAFFLNCTIGTKSSKASHYIFLRAGRGGGEKICGAFVECWKCVSDFGKIDSLVSFCVFDKLSF